MRSLMRVAALVLISLQAIVAHARTYSQGELDALLAPVALYPDPLLAHVLNASAYPQDVAAAAQWRRDHPLLGPDDALRTAEDQPWHPSVKALVAQPDVLSRLAESPEWLAALGEAYLGQPQQVHATVQQLRLRAQSTGSLKSDEHQHVYQQPDQTVVVQPVYPHVVYAPYYNPYIVYGGWWWPAYHPVFFRPWVPRPVYYARPVPVVPLRPVAQPLVPVARPLEPRPAPVMRQPLRQPVQRQQALRSMPAPALQSTPYRAVREARRQPIVNSQSFARGTSITGGNAFRGGGRPRS